MQQLATKFIPATADVYHMETGKDPECTLFRKMVEQGHAEGMPKGSWQGYYALAPSGLLLARVNVSEQWLSLETMLESALAKWDRLSPKERGQSEDLRKQSASIRRHERFYPKDGLVLHAYSRDLPRDPPQEDERANTWNQDFVWFAKAEAKQLVPERRLVGQKLSVPKPLIQRLARFHLLDNVRALAPSFAEEHIAKAQLTVSVTAVKGPIISLRLEGETRANRDDGWSGDERIIGTRNRGLETRLMGKATYDDATHRFISFELVAIGTRWGAGKGSSDTRSTDLGPSPIGFLFTLADNTRVERVAPAKFKEYGWSK